ncbi:MAG: flagellar basal body-associated FliL family protein [Burkholderiaceae bacterium]|nr:flagellar basal body-associated FliL family protein [Burkholderiaceae bacterium]
MKSQAPAHAEEAKPAPAKPPAYLPLETMVVNLADPGGERFAQLGITIELAEDKAAERIRAFLPSIRSSILLLVSQRTSEELLTRQGKEKLAADIAVVVGRPLGDAEDLEAYAKAMAQAASAAEAPKLAAARAGGNPVRGVLFSSFIIQ